MVITGGTKIANKSLRNKFAGAPLLSGIAKIFFEQKVKTTP